MISLRLFFAVWADDRWLNTHSGATLDSKTDDSEEASKTEGGGGDSGKTEPQTVSLSSLSKQ